MYNIYSLINNIFLLIVSQFSIKFSEIEYLNKLVIYQSVVEHVATYIDIPYVFDIIMLFAFDWQSIIYDSVIPEYIN